MMLGVWCQSWTGIVYRDCLLTWPNTTLYRGSYYNFEDTVITNVTSKIPPSVQLMYDTWPIKLNYVDSSVVIVLYKLCRLSIVLDNLSQAFGSVAAVHCTSCLYVYISYLLLCCNIRYNRGLFFYYVCDSFIFTMTKMLIKIWKSCLFSTCIREMNTHYNTGRVQCLVHFTKVFHTNFENG